MNGERILAGASGAGSALVVAQRSSLMSARLKRPLHFHFHVCLMVRVEEDRNGLSLGFWIEAVQTAAELMRKKRLFFFFYTKK